MMVMACAVILMAVLLVGGDGGKNVGLVDILLRIW
ncbi:hypothetical protein SAMN05880570_0626 [Paenibacillus sp. RU4T]|nr:hypothetical protein SAMN05880555_0627 [Paenibacillus sp. RU4X]SIQ30145.1 hypothetical protein SAMN05880570_0626 [Paenibacillus sp. RU4T]